MKAFKQLALIFLAVFLLQTLCAGGWELRVTNDSLAYKGLSGDWTEEYINKKSHIWPPLFPLILSFFPPQGLEMGAFLLQVFGMSMGVYLHWQLARPHLRQAPYLSGLFLFLLLFNTELSWVGQYFWSEGLFFMLYSLFLFSDADPLRKPRPWLKLGSGILMPLQRHSGTFLLLSSFIYQKSKKGNRWKEAPWELLAVLPWLAWVIWSGWLTDVQEFQEEYYGKGWLADLWRLIGSISMMGGSLAKSWVPSVFLPEAGQQALGFLFMAALGFWAIWMTYRPFMQGGDYPVRELQRKLLLTGYGYLCIHTYIGFSSYMDPFRFFAVLWPSFTLVLLLEAQRQIFRMESLQKHKAKQAYWLLLGLVTLWVFLRWARNVYQWNFVLD